MPRLRYVLDLIDRLLGEYSPVARVTEHYTMDEEDLEYLNARIDLPQAYTVVNSSGDTQVLARKDSCSL